VLAAVALLGTACATRVETQPASTAVAEQTIASASGGGGQALVSLNENVVTRTYPVGGTTAAEVRAGLNRGGPYSNDAGRRYDGATTWDLRWSFRYARQPDACSLAAATLDLNVVVVLPELTQPEALAAETLSRWQAYRDALDAHEQGHVGRSRAGAEALAQVYRDMGAFASCRELAAQLTAAGEAVLIEIRAADRLYDIETEHGRSQGAVFP
jgi:predicted secreted Zn-dependent protease